MRELNLKGAVKEGTDMDAFNTPEGTQLNDNCNQQPQQQPQQKPPENTTPVIETVAPVINTTTTPKPADIKTTMKNKVDVTSIVKDVPKNIKPFVTPAPIASVGQESQDETDRVATEKLVQVKNEANIKANAADANDNQVIEKNLIRYKKDQWSPINTDGKRCYDRDFLICLQNNPKCRKKPDNLPDLDVVLKDNRRPMMDTRTYRQSDVLMPPFHKSMSQTRGMASKKGSQQGKASSRSGKPNAIHVTLSLKEDVKLRETENAWRPARLKNSTEVTEEELKTAVSSPLTTHNERYNKRFVF